MNSIRPCIRYILALTLSLAATAAGLAAEKDASATEDAILSRAQLMSNASVIVAKRLKPSVVNITVEHTTQADPIDTMQYDMLRRFFPRLPNRSRRQLGQGSGVIADDRGHVLTNHHVVGNADTIMITLADGRELQAELVGSDPDSDIAVLRIEGDNLHAAKLGNSDDCRVGEWVMAMGNPFGLASSVTSGIISARGRSGLSIVEYEDFIQTDAAINPGNSGGPLVNLRGEVIGINTAIFSKSGGYQGIGFAIPINIARVIMNEIIANKKVTQSYLGVQLQPLTTELAKAFGLESTRGALVLEVLANTPAARAGIKRGDVVLRFGRRDILDDQHMRNLVATTAPGEEVEVLLVRGGKHSTVTVRVEAVPENVQVARRSEKVLEDLGIEVVELTQSLRDRIGYEKDAWGVLVSSVRRGSTAQRIGLRPGSVVLKVDGQEVKTPDELRVALGKADTQKGIDLIWRTGKYLRRVRLSSGE